MHIKYGYLLSTVGSIWATKIILDSLMDGYKQLYEYLDKIFSNNLLILHITTINSNVVVAIIYYLG